MESNLSIPNNNVREGTICVDASMQTGQKASSNSAYDEDVDECDQDFSSDVLFDPNLMQKAVVGKYLWPWCSIYMISIATLFWMTNDYIYFYTYFKKIAVVTFSTPGNLNLKH